MADEKPWFWIRISDGAIESLMLAAVESYALGDGRRKSRSGLETAGLLWGIKRMPSGSTDNRTFIYIDKVAQSLSALRTTESVALHSDAPFLLNGLVSKWAPQVSLLGHFHTHPYNDIKEVRKYNGDRISDGDAAVHISKDRESNLYWQESGDNPVMLVVTVCKLSKVRTKLDGEQKYWNCFRFDMGEFRFWITAVVGYLSGTDVRCHTPDRCLKNNPCVFLDMESKYFNTSGSNLMPPIADT